MTGNLLVADAIALFSGRSLFPKKNGNFRELDSRLLKAGFGATEFVFFVIHHLENGCNRHFLLQVPRLLSEKTWESFLAFKSRRKEETREIVENQVEGLLRNRETFSEEILLLGHIVQANALVRVEMAFRWDPSGNLTRRVIETFPTQFVELFLGSPEFLECLKEVRVRKGELEAVVSSLLHSQKNGDLL